MLNIGINLKFLSKTKYGLDVHNLHLHHTRAHKLDSCFRAAIAPTSQWRHCLHVDVREIGAVQISIYKDNWLSVLSQLQEE